MRKAMLVLAGVLLLAAAPGCAILRDHQDEIKAAIVSYVENQGREKAEKYVDDLVAKGELTEKQAARIKEAIPQGVAKVKEVLQ